MPNPPHQDGQPNPLIDVQEFGQSIWYDNLSRSLITSGALRNMVERDGVLGVTSNPAIFEKAVSGSADYDPAIRALVAQGAGDAQALFEQLAIQDIQLAADILYPVYCERAGRDGFVSLEVSPYLASDTEGTVVEARRLWRAVGRENLLIKVPATPEGLPAIEQLIAEGISVNVTLLFAVDVYQAVAQAYMAGLEQRVSRGDEIGAIASVASFFVSRIDSLVDDQATRELDRTSDAARRSKLESLISQVAIANAKLAYECFQELRGSDRWRALAARGARPQRVLWASTGTKNPAYSKTLYVDSLIGPDTVNTLPGATFDAFKRSGTVRNVLEEDRDASLERAHAVMADLAEVGISLKDVTDQLTTKGVQLFADAFDNLLAAIETKRQHALGTQLAAWTSSLADGDGATSDALERWRSEGRVRRLWSGDASLWSGADEADWLGWLQAPSEAYAHLDELERFASEVVEADFQHVVVLGMGGASLWPDVLARVFPRERSFPELLVLDSTVPAQIRTVADRIDPARSLFVASSKSGGTIESALLERFFLARVTKAVGAERAGGHFVAITDPGSPLEGRARDAGFRWLFLGNPRIGGRFSALSNFGMVPAAAMGLDLRDLLRRALLMVESCAPCVPPAQNPGVALGLAVGTLATQGRDKLTFVTSKELAPFGAWLDQLVAESTGKAGKGIVSVAGEALGPPGVYGDDRLFLHLRLARGATEEDAALAALERAGHPVVRIEIAEPLQLGQEVVRWEMAVATACALLGVNAFTQPDVEAAKRAAVAITDAYEQTGRLPEDEPIARDGEIALFADVENARALAAQDDEAVAILRAHLGRIEPGDYFAINAYVEMNDANDALLQPIRHAVRDARRVATMLGYGPRFLHSTGQLHKGGPDTGVFLQITCDDRDDLDIPDQRFSFGVLKQAQALGDLRVLAERGRRVLRVHLPADVERGLAALGDLVTRALGD